VPVLSEFRLDGRAVIVTGASRSMGRAIAKTLAEAGADVALGARSVDDLHGVASEIESLGRRALAVPCDVDDAAAVQRLVDETVATFGRLDVLVANAGRFQVIDAAELELSDFDELLTTNLRGVAAACLAAGRAMIARGEGGSIVTITSIQAHIGIQRTASYVAAKHGVLGLTKTLALEWAAHDIRVNAIAPAFIARDVEPLQDDPAFVAYVKNRTPLGRWGTGREIGLAAVFLASDASSYVTGTTLAVDGGWLAG
jgi:NAD(P)-dependent dehydrogenase (short-subunit alcohol dehydrogenase family)